MFVISTHCISGYLTILGKKGKECFLHLLYLMNLELVLNWASERTPTCKIRTVHVSCHSPPSIVTEGVTVVSRVHEVSWSCLNVNLPRVQFTKFKHNMFLDSYQLIGTSTRLQENGHTFIRPGVWATHTTVNMFDQYSLRITLDMEPGATRSFCFWYSSKHFTRVRMSPLNTTASHFSPGSGQQCKVN